jgi:hypothetical protein
MPAVSIISTRLGSVAKMSDQSQDSLAPFLLVPLPAGAEQRLS